MRVVAEPDCHVKYLLTGCLTRLVFLEEVADREFDLVGATG